MYTHQEQQNNEQIKSKIEQFKTFLSSDAEKGSNIKSAAKELLALLANQTHLPIAEGLIETLGIVSSDEFNVNTLVAQLDRQLRNIDAHLHTEYNANRFYAEFEKLFYKFGYNDVLTIKYFDKSSRKINPALPCLLLIVAEEIALRRESSAAATLVKDREYAHFIDTVFENWDATLSTFGTDLDCTIVFKQAWYDWLIRKIEALFQEFNAQPVAKNSKKLRSMNFVQTNNITLSFHVLITDFLPMLTKENFDTLFNQATYRRITNRPEILPKDSDEFYALIRNVPEDADGAKLGCCVIS